MPIRNYYTFNGAVVAEYTPNVTGYRTYGRDALGSVLATYDDTGSLQNTYRYSPYGSILASSTPAASPYFTWVGTQGYRVTNRPYSEFYARGRHYTSTLCRWTSVDPLWPSEPSYVYAFGRPVGVTDPSGAGPYKCERCALALFLLYNWTQAHDCFHKFIHCFVCCVLSHEFDEDCARDVQNSQPGTTKQKVHRMEGCGYGIAGNTPTAKCESYCAAEFGTPSKSKDCPPGIKPQVPFGGHLPAICYNCSPLTKFPWGGYI